MDKEKFYPSAAQEKAFEKVIDAIKEAKRKGLSFYGKCGNLVAYNKVAQNYEDEHGFDTLLHANGGQIPYLSANVLHDSGADDYISFLEQ